MKFAAPVLAILTLGMGGAAMADPIPLVNGGFETTNFADSRQFGTGYAGGTYQVAGWNTSGYNFLFTPGDSVATGSAGDLSLWGPSHGVANGLGPSPLGGNYIAADGDYGVAAISQSVSGLTVGAQYNVTFYWAAAQQHGFSGPTTEAWNVTFGSQTFSTPTYSLANHGFSGWMEQTFTYTATATTQTLSFLAHGTPVGLPPFSLLDGVSVNSVSPLPEPATWAMMIVGLGAVGAGLRRRARPTLATA